MSARWAAVTSAQSETPVIWSRISCCTWLVRSQTATSCARAGAAWDRTATSTASAAAAPSRGARNRPARAEAMLDRGTDLRRAPPMAGRRSDRSPSPRRRARPRRPNALSRRPRKRPRPSPPRSACGSTSPRAPTLARSVPAGLGVTTIRAPPGVECEAPAVAVARRGARGVSDMRRGLVQG